MRQNIFRGLVAVGCSIAASFGAAAMVAGCTGDDFASGTVTTDDAGTIIFDSGTKLDASSTDGSIVIIVGDASVCPSTQALCGGACATLARDVQNCGVCGVTCGSGEACSAGKCTTSCGGEQSFCAPGDAGDAGSPYCASFASDNANCGSCGHQCGAGEMCNSGSCQTSCGGSQTICNASGDAGSGDGGAPFCATLSTDDSNCGACGNACSAGKSCQSAVCKVTCAPSDTLCSSVDGTTDGTDGGVPYCATTASDNANCGACGHTCGAGQVCNGGVCGTTCAAPETICSSVDGLTDGTDGGAPYCANFSTDNANCGSCGSSCGAGQACVNGSCSTTCEGDLLLCGSKCIDPSSSITNCGATAACDSDAGTSGTACDPTTQACSAGSCAALKLVPKFVASFNVNDGPVWFDAPQTYSCVQACALLNGGDPSDYGCSTVPGSLNHLAWESKVGSNANCNTGSGTPLADDFSNGLDYFEGGYSAYIQDWCFDGNSINYCWTVPPTVTLP